MIAVGGAVWAALMPMWNTNDSQSNKYWISFEEPEDYTSEVLFKFQILSDNGRSIKNVLEGWLNKSSDFIRSFPLIYEIIEKENTFELKMIMGPYMLHHSQIIELLTNKGFISGEDYILNWIFGSWNRKTKEFNL